MKKFASEEQENRVQNFTGDDKTKEQKPHNFKEDHTRTWMLENVKQEKENNEDKNPNSITLLLMLKLLSLFFSETI